MRRSFLLLVLLCSGCSALQQTPTAPVPGRASDLDCWHLEGKIAVRDENDSGSAYVHWRHAGDEFHLQISGPLGTGAAVAYGNASRVVMRLADDRILVGRTAEALVARHFGWRIPFAALDWWARGLPIPGEPAEITDGPDQLPAQLNQAGWNVLIQQYGSYSGYQLPEKLELNQGERRVRVRIRDWLPGNCTLES